MGERVPAHTESKDVGRAVAGDQAAFERLYRGHVSRVYSLALRLAGPAEADDLTQEVFIRAWTKLGTYKGEARFGTWLHRLAVNHILSRRTALKRWDARHAFGDSLLGRLLARRERSSGERLDLEDALQLLPKRAKEVFVLYDVEGYGHEEIAEALGVSVGTSKSQLHRARMLLRERLS